MKLKTKKPKPSAGGTGLASGTRSTLTLDPWRVKPFADQPRKRFRGIKQLAESIRLVGQVTPIIVTPADGNGFDAELLDGERRLQACRSADIRIKAVVEEKVSADVRFALSIAANFCRQGHDCIEIAEAVERLQAEGRTYEQIALIFGKTISFVSQHLSLRRLHPAVQNMLERAGDEARQTKREIRARGRMTFSVALLLVPLDEASQLKAAKHIAKKKLSMAAARNYVWKLGNKKGRPVGRTVSPHQKFQKLWNQTDTYRHAVERYATLRYADWEPVLAAMKTREARVLAGQLRRLSEDLGGIADVLEKAGER